MGIKPKFPTTSNISTWTIWHYMWMENIYQPNHWLPSLMTNCAWGVMHHSSSWESHQSWLIWRQIHSLCVWSESRFGRGLSFSFDEARQSQAGIAFRKCIAWKHQRDRLCRIWQCDRDGQCTQHLVRLLGMNNQQLVSILKRDHYTSPLLCRVYPINCLPPIWECLYVINRAPDNHPGLHWIALFC